MFFSIQHNSLETQTIVTWINSPLVFIAEYYSLELMYHSLFYHFSIEGHLGHFQVWLLWTKLLWILFTGLINRIFCFSGINTQNTVAGSYSSYVFTFMINCQIIIHNNCTILYPHQQCMSDLLHLHYGFLLVVYILCVWQMYTDIYSSLWYHTENFTVLKILCALPTHPSFLFSTWQPLIFFLSPLFWLFQYVI